MKKEYWSCPSFTNYTYTDLDSAKSACNTMDGYCFGVQQRSCSDDTNFALCTSAGVTTIDYACVYQRTFDNGNYYYNFNLNCVQIVLKNKDTAVLIL